MVTFDSNTEDWDWDDNNDTKVSLPAADEHPDADAPNDGQLDWNRDKYFGEPSNETDEDDGCTDRDNEVNGDSAWTTNCKEDEDE